MRTLSAPRKRRADAGVKRPKIAIGEQRKRDEPSPWCMRCGGPVIWMKPPEICLMCKSTAISREEMPDEDPGYFGIHEHTRRFLRAVRYYDRLEAARRAAQGESDVSS